MLSTYERHKRIIALLLVAAMVVAMVGCTKKTDTESDLSILSSKTETTLDETTEMTTTTENTSAPEVSEKTPSEITEATSGTSTPSETTLERTATPTDTPADPTVTTEQKPTEPKPKAPKETKATATPTTAPTNTSAPTPIPTDTPTPTPTTAPKETKKATDYSGTIKSAVKQAITDKCGWKTGFVFNDKVMENAKARAKYSVNNNVLGHVDMPGTVVGFEGCGSSGCTYLSDTDELEWFWTDESGNNHYYKGDPYQCYYDFAASLVVEHVNKLSSDTEHIYFGYGVSIKYTPWERSNGLGTVEEWTIVVYIEGETEMALNSKFS